jgi:hypothetical protein
VSVRYPPRVGPITGATTTPSPNSAIAIPRRAGEKLSIRMDCESGCKAPPPAPWATRASSKNTRLGAAPHKKDDTVKMATHVIRKRLRPNLSANQLLVGRITAFATR